MDALTSTFHIDIKLIIAQVINFAIVLVLVYFVLGKSILKMMHKREMHIKEGIEKAKKAENALLSAEEEKQNILNDARNEAKSQLENANKQGVEIIENAKAEGLVQKNQIIQSGEKEVAQQKNNLDAELKREASILIRQGVESVLKNSLTKEDVEKIISNVK